MLCCDALKDVTRGRHRSQTYCVLRRMCIDGGDGCGGRSPETLSCADLRLVRRHLIDIHYVSISTNFSRSKAVYILYFPIVKSFDVLIVLFHCLYWLSMS